MNKKATAPKKAKPKRVATAPNPAGWPAQANAGIKNARSIHDRKPVSRGGGRGG